MLIKYNKNYEKTAMGLLSYLPDFKNLANLQEEMKLNQKNAEFQLYLYRQENSNIIGVLGTQKDDPFVVIRYLSLAPGFREEKYQKRIMTALKDAAGTDRITAVPDYTYLLKWLRAKDEQ